MRKRICMLTLSVLASTYTTAALANENIYVGGYASHQDIDVLNKDFNVAGLIAGYNINRFLSVETRLGKGLSDNKSSYGTGNEFNSYQEEIGWQASVNLKSAYQLYDTLSVYGLLGYSYSEFDAASVRNGTSQPGSSLSNSDFNYGAGLSFHVTQHLNIFIDYQVMPDLEDDAGFSADWESATLGVEYQF